MQIQGPHTGPGLANTHNPTYEAIWIHCKAGAAITRGLAVEYDLASTGDELGFQVALAGAATDGVCGVAAETKAADELILVQCYGICDFATTDGTVADAGQCDSNASGVISAAAVADVMANFAYAIDNDVGTVGKIFIKNCM